MRTNRIHLFFLGLALLFWNPLSFYLLYKNTPSFQYKGFLIFYSLVFVLGLLVGYLIYRNRIREKLKNLVLSAGILGILFATFVIVNKSIGEPIKEKEGLIFVPGTEVKFKTVEFEYSVLINSVGLRDNEFNLDKGNKFRIVCLGDSWTIGWGVNLEESYPKQLERFLRGKGQNVQVINCGQAGAHTSIYKSQLRKILPVLKPDLVVVGLLQGDDLAQCYETDSSQIKMAIKPEGRYKKLKACVKTYLNSSLGNIIALFKHKKPVSVDQNWQKSATSVIESFTPQQKIRFQTFQDTVQQLFKTGNLNPSLMSFYLNFPDRMLVFNDPNNAATQMAIKKMDNDLREMKSTCDSNYVRLLVSTCP